MIFEENHKVMEDIASLYSLNENKEICKSDIFNALFILLADKYELEFAGELWNIEITYNEAMEVLSNFDFNTFNQKIVIDDDILPLCHALIIKIQIKSEGNIWYIHKYDSDPFPSNPHAHNIENNIKLDLSNGKCYKKRKYIFQIPKDKFLKIREKAENKFNGKLPLLNFNEK